MDKTSRLERISSDFPTHRHVYDYIRKKLADGVSASDLNDMFIGCTDIPNWHTREGREYLYLNRTLVPSCVDFVKFLREVESPFDEFRQMIRLAKDHNLYLEAVSFFYNIDPRDVFDQNDRQTRVRIEELNDNKTKNSYVLMLDPYDEYFVDWFKYTQPTNDQYWPNDTLTLTKPYLPGINTIVSKQEFIERFREFSCGLFEKPVNKDCTYEFPYNNVIFAGGSIQKLLESRYVAKPNDSSDIDIFVVGDTKRELTLVFEQIINWFKSPRTYYAIKSSVVSIYIEDIPRVFQVINSNFIDAWEICRHFDMSYIQWTAIYKTKDKKIIDAMASRITTVHTEGWNIRGTPAAFESMKTGLNCVLDKKTQRETRLVKSLIRGYVIKKDDNCMDLSHLYNKYNKRTLRDIKGEILSSFYPRSSQVEGLDEEERELTQTSLIQKFSGAKLITSNMTDVLNNTIIGGDFTKDYDAMNFIKFKFENIRFRGPRGPHQGRIQVKDINNTITIMSEIVTVTAIDMTENKVLIKCHYDSNDFARFIEDFETRGIAIYGYNGVTESILNKESESSGTFNLEIPMFKIDGLHRNGRSIARDNKGEPIDLTDIREQDNIQFLFNIIIENKPDDNMRPNVTIGLNPVKIIKIIEADAEQEVINVNVNNTINIEPIQTPNYNDL